MLPLRDVEGSGHMFTPYERDAALARELELLEADRRVEAAVVTGSLGAGREDRWSDIDVACVVADGESCESVAAEWVALTYREWPVVHHYETDFGTTLVRGFLLVNGLVIDLAFTPSADFEVWAPIRVVFDRTGAATKAAAAWQPWSPEPAWRREAGFAWHDVVHACNAANRARHWQSVFYLQRIRNRTLSLASERHGHDADEFAHVDDLPDHERDPLLASLIDELDRNVLLAAIEVATQAFLDELHRGDPELAERLASPLLAFVQASKQSPESAG
jgi:predicted nucleotidyltransferase